MVLVRAPCSGRQWIAKISHKFCALSGLIFSHKIARNYFSTFIVENSELKYIKLQKYCHSNAQQLYVFSVFSDLFYLLRVLQRGFRQRKPLWCHVARKPVQSSQSIWSVTLKISYSEISPVIYNKQRNIQHNTAAELCKKEGTRNQPMARWEMSV